MTLVENGLKTTLSFFAITAGKIYSLNRFVIVTGPHTEEQVNIHERRSCQHVMTDKRLSLFPPVRYGGPKYLEFPPGARTRRGV